MGSMDSAFIRTPAGGDADWKAIGRRLKFRQFYAGITYSQFVFEPYVQDPPEEILCEISEQYSTEVVYIQYQSIFDCIHFAYWNTGKIVRKFVQGNREQAMWDIVEGEPQPWEHELFFSQEGLDIYLKDCDNPADREEAVAIWNEARLVPGRTLPPVDSKGVFYVVMESIPFLVAGSSDDEIIADLNPVPIVEKSNVFRRMFGRFFG